MTPFYVDPLVTLYLGDCNDVMRELPDASVDAVVCDPPYGIEFMGRDWDRLDNGYNAKRWEGRRTAGEAPERDPDSPGGRHGAATSPSKPNPLCSLCGHYKFSSSPCQCENPVWAARPNEQAKRMQAWHEAWATEAFRVLKPGGHLLAFGGTRTVHRLAAAIEDAGFEIRDMLMWIYACLSEDTEILTNRGWVRYNKVNEDDLAAAFDTATGELRWESVEAVHIYRQERRTMVQVGPSLVTLNHRVVLSPESQVPLPSDAELRRLWDRLPDVGPLPGNAGEDLLDRVPVGATAGTTAQEVTGRTQGPDGGVRDVRRGVLATYGVATSVEGSLLLQPVQRDASDTGSPVHTEPDDERGPEAPVVGGNEGSEQLGLEGRRYRVQEARELLWSALRASSRVGAADGPQGRVRNGAPPTDGRPLRLPDDQDRGGEPREPRPDRQPARESDDVAGQSDPQAVRVGQGDRGDGLPVDAPRLVDYAGLVWCITVASGAFVARRGGVAFVTGNSGFPKSLDVGKALDKAAGAERERIGAGPYDARRPASRRVEDGGEAVDWHYGDGQPITAPATDLARQWDGWGTALKPAHEPIVMARKPLVGTVAGNVARFGTGALNIGATRIAHETINNGNLADNPHLRDTKLRAAPQVSPFGKAGDETPLTSQAGRWPSNVMLSDPELFDSPNPEVVGSGAVAGDFTQGRYHLPDRSAPDAMFAGGRLDAGNTYTDSGGYSRFFIIPKSDRAERERGLAGAPTGKVGGRNRADGRQWDIPGSTVANGKPDRANTHPTVKPIDLMRHLVRLVTPPGGVCLDPFLGSGTTALAASEEGMRCIGIERELEYLEIAKGRLIATPMGLGLDVGAPVRKAPKTHPDLSKHQPKRRAPANNWSGPWAGNEHLHRFPADSQVCDCGVTAAEFYNQEPAA